MTFDDAFTHLVGLEGHYSNNPLDSGGETCWGVTVLTARACGYVGEMRDMPLPVAKAIYKTKYWSKVGGDGVANIYPRVAYELFDTAVNIGPAKAVQWLQEALNIFNNRGSFYPDQAVDGVAGAATFSALSEYQKRRGAEGEDVLLRYLNVEQGAFYNKLCKTREKDEAFVYGWYKNRIVI